MKIDRWCFITQTISVLLLVSFVSVDGQDLIRRATANTCKNDLDCPDNAFCKYAQGTSQTDSSGFCSCKTTYILHLFNDTHKECLKEANDLGDVCRVNIQCQSKLSVNSECIDNICKCKNGAHFDEGRCYMTSLIGQKCSVTQNCYLGPDHISSNQAFCVRGICQCNLLHSPRDGGIRCLKDAALGDECEDDEHCTGEHMRCQSVCRCEEKHVVHPSEQRCLKAASEYNEKCEIDAQCTHKMNYTTCLDERCVCQYGYHFTDNRCWLTRSIGYRCEANQECTMENNERGQCLNGFCTCKGCTNQGRGNNGISISPKILFTILMPVILSLLLIK